MKRLSIFFLSLLTILVMVGAGWAATYYVDPDAVDGAGTQVSPYQYFFNTGPRIALNPGDSVLFKRGTLTPNSRILYNFSGDGTGAGHVITIGDYGSGSLPIILADYIAIASSGWTDVGGGIYTKDVGIIIAFGTLLEDYRPLRQATTALNVGTNGSWFYDSGSHLLTYKPTATTPASHNLKAVDSTGSFTIYPNGVTAGSYVSYRNLQFIGASAFAGGSAADITNSTFTGCLFSGKNGAEAMLLFHANTGYHFNNIIIDTCTFDYCANNIYFIVGTGDETAYFDTIHISNCHFLHTGLSYDGKDNTDAYDNDGISCQNIKNALIENNEMSGMCSQWAGITSWNTTAFSATGNVFRNNYIHDNQGAGITIQGGQTSGSDQYDIYNNLIVNCKGTSVNLRGGLNLFRFQNSTTKSHIYNNTIWGCYTGIFLGAGGPNQNDADYYVIENNIVGDSTDYQGMVYNGTIRTHNVLDYNLYYPAGGNNFSYNGTAVPWATWKTDIGNQEAHSVTVYPIFVGESSVTQTGWSLAANPPPTYTDTFQRTAANPLDGSWTTANSLGALKSTAGHVVVAATDSTYSAAFSTAGTFTSDQWTQVAWDGTTSYQGFGLRLSAASQKGIVAFVGGDNVSIQVKENTGSSYALVGTLTASALHTGSLIKGSITGTTLTVYVDGNSVGTEPIDASITGGAPGIFDYSSSGGVTAWSGGNVGAGTYTFTYKSTLATRPDQVTEGGTALTLVADIPTVESTAGSWYWDGTYVYVHASDGTDPTGKTMAVVNADVSTAANLALTSNTPTTVYQGGVDLSALFTTDYAGTIRAVPWSIGAYQYGATATMPAVTTQAITSYNKGAGTATGHGTITDDGGGVTENGTVWNTTGTPTTSDTKVTTADHITAYTTSLTGLPATIFFYRSYAINSAGTSYGSQMVQNAGGSGLSMDMSLRLGNYPGAMDQGMK